MIGLARGYTIKDENTGNFRHLNDNELRKEIKFIMGGKKEEETSKDKIGKLYDTIAVNIGELRRMGMPEDEVFNYMTNMTLGIFKNTISSITLINPSIIPDEFAKDIASCIKKDKDNNIKVERYTDSEIVLKAKEEGLYSKHVFIFPKEYNHATAGEIERLDHACLSHYQDLKEFGVDNKDMVAIMNNLTNDLYREMLSVVLEEEQESISDEFINKIRRGKVDKDGNRKSYSDSEAELLFAYEKSKASSIKR
jgi:hypothetical protein